MGGSLVDLKARFDDLTQNVALEFSSSGTVLAARSGERVAEVLDGVEAATSAGAWSYGFVSYEAASGLNPTLQTRGQEGQSDGLPQAWFALCEPPAVVPCVTRAQGRSGTNAQWIPDWSDLQYMRAVEAIKMAIAAGETYQCNLTDRLRTARRIDPAALYARLAFAQRGRYNAMIDLGESVIVSASPELFFEWRDSLIRTRPMKGTAARGRTPASDRAAAQSLRDSPKERAENIMIVDLLRNDLAAVAQTGTVVVDELLTVERYPSVWQMVSEVAALPAPNVNLSAIFRALFPCGSVTGAPKARTMKLISELEPCARGVYCGAIGIVAPPEHAFRARFSVAIRTAVVHRDSAVYGAGGGITWASNPHAERAELLLKADLLGG